MFTGIITELGSISRREAQGAGARITIHARATRPDLVIGDSIAVNGTCLTVESLSASGFTADLSAETVARTTLGSLQPGHRINLEPAARLGDRLGGHIVQGHVDGIGSCRGLDRSGSDGGAVLTIAAPEPILRYAIEKGSVAVDGVSLTIASLLPTGFTVALIPHTLAVTTLGDLSSGDEVNLEADLIGKYVERLLTRGVNQVTDAADTADRFRQDFNKLRQHGFA